MIRRAPYDSPQAQTLVTAAMAELGQRYGGEGDSSPLAPEEFVPPHGDFLVCFLTGSDGDTPVACAGWRAYGADGRLAELKRMYTAVSVRGRGVARQLLEAVEQSARDHSRTRMILECGRQQPEAVALYTAAGYARIPDFGHYRHEPDVLSFGRDLTGPDITGPDISTDGRGSDGESAAVTPPG